MPDTKMEPALTPEEWAHKWATGVEPEPGTEGVHYYRDEERGIVTLCVSGYEQTYIPIADLPKVVALANDLLPHSDPRKLTREDVRYLRELAANQDEVSYMMGGRGRSPLGVLADRLASLLPPSDPRSDG